MGEDRIEVTHTVEKEETKNITVFTCDACGSAVGNAGRKFWGYSTQAVDEYGRKEDGALLEDTLILCGKCNERFQ